MIEPGREGGEEEGEGCEEGRGHSGWEILYSCKHKRMVTMAKTLWITSEY